MYTDSGSLYVVDQSVIAHSTSKGNAVVMTKHPVAYPVLGLVSCAFKIRSLITHITTPLQQQVQSKSCNVIVHLLL